MIVFNSAFLIIMSMVLAFAAKTTFTRLNQVGVDIHLYTGHPFFKLVMTHSHHFYAFLFLVLVTGLVISNAIIIFFTQKMIGPIIHLEHYFKNIVKRERAPRHHLKFRRGDFFDHLPDTINGAIHLLQSGIPEDTQTLPPIRRS